MDGRLSLRRLRKKVAGEANRVVARSRMNNPIRPATLLQREE